MEQWKIGKIENGKLEIRKMEMEKHNTTGIGIETLTVNTFQIFVKILILTSKLG